MFKKIDELDCEIKNPKDYRWLVCLLCLLSFLLSFCSVVHAADGSFVLDSVTYGYTDLGNNKVDFTLTKNGKNYTFTLKDFDSSYDDYFIGYEGDYNKVKIYLISSASTFYCENSSDWVVMRDIMHYSFSIYSDTFSYESVALPGSSNFVIDNDDGSYIVTSSVDIHRKNGDLFFQAPPPWTILTGVTLTNPLNQVLKVLGTVLMVIVGYLALRKAIQLIMVLLKNS